MSEELCQHPQHEIHGCSCVQGPLGCWQGPPVAVPDLRQVTATSTAAAFRQLRKFSHSIR